MVEIKEVKTRKERKRFVDFANIMYQDVPQFVPSFYGDDLADWGPKNPALAYCERKAFLAYKDGECVGRIGAILSHASNEKWNTKRMRFSQVDFIDDFEVSKALFKAVEDYALEKGCNEVHGPLGFTDLDREGMLVEGFEERSLFFTYYNYPYYNDHLVKLGYVKDVDWVEDKLYVKDAEEVQDQYRRVAEFSLKHNNLHIAKLNKQSEYPSYVKKFFNLVNICYSKLYSTIELTEEQINMYAKKFSPLINPDFVCFVMDEEENLIAFGVLAMSMGEALKKTRGRLFPTGWARVLRSLKKSKSLESLLVAVHPDYQKKGVNAILIDYILTNAIRHNIEFAETGPQLELNHDVRAQWKYMQPQTFKRRRCYIKKISDK